LIPFILYLRFSIEYVMVETEKFRIIFTLHKFKFQVFFRRLATDSTFTTNKADWRRAIVTVPTGR